VSDGEAGHEGSWGVAHDPVTGLIYASDMNSGILRRTDG